MKILSLVVVFSLFVMPTYGAANRNAPAQKKEYFENMIVPSVSLEDITLEISFDVARSRAQELDTQAEANLKGFKVQPLPAHAKQKPISFEASNLTLSSLLKELAVQAKLDLHLTSIGVIFSTPGSHPIPKTMRDKAEVWHTIYRVPTKP